MLAYLLAAVAAVLTLVLTLLANPIAAATGLPVTVVRAVILVVGVAAIAASLLLKKKLEHVALPGSSAGNTKSPQGASLDQLLAEAESKIKSSKRSDAKSLRALPLLYLLGDENAAKTTIVLKSGLEPELLAGQIYRDKDVVPTPLVNVWYSGKTALVEAGDAVRKDAGLWNRLILRTRPVAARAAFGDGAPFRAAVVCVSCDLFLGTAKSAEALQAAAAETGERLRQLSRSLGTQLPVYVLFTKLDRVPGFADFVRNVSWDEGNQLLGAAPAEYSSTSGYAENATTAISTAFDGLVFALAGSRVELLGRESDLARLAPTYEFPRELRKFRNNLVTYLVELVRPSQLDSNPYLRGFYFTGVRAQIRESSVSAPVQAPAAAFDPGATSIFSSMPQAAAPQQPAFATSSEKVAQWTFLAPFFPHAILSDTSALANTATTRHAATFRRILYAAASLLLLCYLLLLTVSFFKNAALEREIESASSALRSSPTSTATLASTEQLTLLDSLRQRLLLLEDYHQNGAPLMYTWGLYRGNSLLVPARRIYFEHFRALLLNRTQGNLVRTMDALPATPAPGAEYNGTYNALRGYLITTSHPEKSKADFLTPVLLSAWQAGGPEASSEQSQLAARQFDFYANELPIANPYSIAPAGATVTHTRAYLNSFGGIERIYQSMLTAAEKSGPAINFNASHPRSAETVVEPHIIQPAFTKPGYGFMQDALAHPDRYFSGEAWVLGDQAPPSIDLGPVRQQLSARYQSDYLAQWRAFLKDAQVIHYANLKDAGVRLTVLSGNNSPLLALFATVSQNTSVPDTAISSAFQAPQALVPGNTADVLIGPGNKSYVDALLALNGAISGVAGNPAGASDPAAAMPISSAASAAHLAAQQTAQAFHIDAAAHLDATTLALMEAPIASAEGLVRGIGPAAANAGGKSFCSAYNALFSKVPFAPNATLQASPAEITAIFQPGTGSLWQFYISSLKAILIQQGTDYVQAPNAPMQVNPAFAHFFSRAAQLSQAFFPAGATAPSLTFALRNLPSSGIQSSAVKVDAQSLTNTEVSKQFNWSSATASSASLTANNLPLSFSGPWSVFQLFGKAKAQRVGPAYDLSFPLELANTPVKGPDGTPVVAHFELSGPGAEVLAPGALSQLHCVNVVATK